MVHYNTHNALPLASLNIIIIWLQSSIDSFVNSNSAYSERYFEHTLAVEYNIY